MDRDKILIVIPDLQLGGGAQRIAAEVGSNLNKRDYEVTFFTVYDEDNTYEYDGEYITLDRPRSSLPLGFSLNILRAGRRIARICKERNIDTVISFMMMGNLGAVLSRVLFRNKAKVVVSVRNNPLKSDKKSRWQKKMLYGKADKVVALSEGVEHILKKDFSLSNTTYIHNIQDIEKFNKLAEKEVKE
ncbi:MAG: glycosyltransferase, partial [Candidatus Saliniplasma sp.]